jgi:hypothetical protein
MNILTQISQFISKILSQKNLLIFILAAALIIISMCWFKSCGDLKDEQAREKQNTEAQKNKLDTTRDKNGNLQTSIVVFEAKNAKDVKNYSDSLEKAITALKNRKPEVIIQTKIVYKLRDTIIIKNTVVNDGNGKYELPWSYTSKDTSMILAGTSTFTARYDTTTFKIKFSPGQTFITTDELRLDFTVGEALNTKTGLKEIFVTPSDPNVHVRSLHGVSIGQDKKPSKFSFGTQLGVGMVYNKGLIVPGPCLSVGLSYRLF